MIERRPPSSSLRPLAGGAALALSPSIALAHGPPGWLFLPTLSWIIIGLFVSLAGMGTIADAMKSSRKDQTAGNAVLVLYAAAGMAAIGLILAAVLVAQGPWSYAFALIVGVVAALLGILAVGAWWVSRPSKPR